MSAMDKTTPLNVLGEPLQSCSADPVTGFYRDGLCRCGPDDLGVHAVCVVMTNEFLAFSRERGNDLSTPVPAFGFPGLRAGDSWCLCATRWQEAYEAGCPPRVRVQATGEAALEHCDLGALKRHAVDLS